MNKVVTVNLYGNAYQLDEDGYALLRDYLDSARARLGGNPDLEEIMADLEQAIAEKVHRVPFDARGVIDQAKSRCSSLGNGREWKRRSRIRQRWSRRGAASEVFGSLLGLVVLFLGLIVGVYVLIGLVRWSTPMLIGSPGPMVLHSPPWWAPALLLLLGSVMLASIARGGQDRPPFLVSLLSTTMQLLLLLFVIWIAYRAFPFVREVVDGTMITLHRAFY